MTISKLRYDFARFKQSDNWSLACIVTINASVWFVLLLFPDLEEVVGLPKQPTDWIMRPWTLLTYMFVQLDVWNLIFNMLMIWWFGTVLLISVKRGYVWCLYLAGGLAGGLLYLLADVLSLQESGRFLVGSSAAMLAVVTAATMRAPDYSFRLLLIGSVRLRWIALVVVIWSMSVIFYGKFGSGAAHFGGISAGLLWGYAIRRGRDIFRPFMRPKFAHAKREPHRSAARFKKQMEIVRDENAELDSLLDKVRVSGYSSLTTKEREKLTELSQKI